ncbi:flagellin FlaB [Halopenitus malekzadehii]|uniref:Flagellin n=1 Tax=Halopenitus malekzadehii TaxID=1267564 RepID=A0A1H6HUC7_9EURY|nr:archaellin/type IV pilin N-terminal domain-containing protein [Halopenitus malekzadehii]SEH38697.1 flagellin FlaB [Halopenitus malekzadehii]
MFERITEDEERGQVGIGTLIVFIAMVLVAAIAAGVLINTAGFLQEQSEATGEESTQQVTDRVQVIGTVGEDTDTNGTSDLNTFNFTVTKSPGSSEIELTDATVQIIHPGGSSTTALTQDDIHGVGDNSGTALTSDNDRLKIQLGTAVLEEGEDATFHFTTASGATTTVTVRAPDSFDDGDTVFL